MYRKQDTLNKDPDGKTISSGSVYSNEVPELTRGLEGGIPLFEVVSELQKPVLREGSGYNDDFPLVVSSGTPTRTGETIVFYVPYNLNLEEQLSQYDPHSLKDIDKYYYVINKLYVTPLIDKRFSSATPALPFLSQNSSSSLNCSSNSYKYNIIPSSPTSINTIDQSNNSLSYSLSTYGVYSECQFTPNVETSGALEERWEKFTELTSHKTKEVNRGYIPLNAKRLRTVLTCDLTKPIMNTLTLLNIIESDNRYIPGIKSTGYRLTDLYQSGPFKTVTINDTRFRNKLVKIKQREIQSLNPLHQQIFKNMYSFYFDSTSAESLLCTMNLPTKKYFSVKIAIDKIVKQDFFFSTGKKTGRIFHNYCNLKSELRRFILDENHQKMVEIDISNSQPFFLSVLLKKNSVESEDVRKYDNLTKDGTLYEYIAEKYHLKRQDVKIPILIYLFGPNHWQSRLKDIFRQEFPTVYSQIEKMKEHNYKVLAPELQKAEAEIMINIIGLKLLKRGMKFITIHDSLMVSERDVELTLTVMEQAFLERFGIIPKFRVTRGGM